MNTKTKRRPFICLITGLLCLGNWGCGPPPESFYHSEVLADISEPESNQCPEIADVFFSESTVGGGEQVRIAVTAVDPDSPKLFYLWEASFGELTGRDGQALWTAPECDEFAATPMICDISVDVSDGYCLSNRIIPITVDCHAGYATGTPDMIIHFPTGGSLLSSTAKQQLDDLAALLQQHPEHTLRVEGHADATGSETVNQQIAQQRAESVKRYLVEQRQIAPERISAISAGASRPIDSNETESGRQKNRRVEIYRLL